MVPGAAPGYPSNQPTLVANSGLLIRSLARRSAQPASAEKFGLARDTRVDLWAGLGNSPPVSQPQADSSQWAVFDGMRKGQDDAQVGLLPLRVSCWALTFTVDKPVAGHHVLSVVKPAGHAEVPSHQGFGSGTRRQRVSDGLWTRSPSWAPLVRSATWL